MHIAIHAPFKPYFLVNTSASVIRTNHILPKFIILGINVSPAPRNEPAATMDAPYIGSANASIRNTIVPSLRILSSGVRSAIIAGAVKNMAAPVTAMLAMPNHTVILANFLASSLRPAPMLCPVSVAAASPIP